jgi:DNA replication licensing factor MCM5
MIFLFRYLVDRVVPGTRVTVMGVYTTIEGGKGDGKQKKKIGGGVALRTPYIHVVGLHVDDPTKGSFSQSFSPQEEEEFAALGAKPNLYEAIAHSIAPAIYGLDDVKKAIACQLFGGSRKHLPDGMKLRGDINILLLGDPGVKLCPL